MPPGASAARAADPPFTSEGRVAVASKNGDASSRLSLPQGAPGGQSVPLFPHNHLRLHRMESFFVPSDRNSAADAIIGGKCGERPETVPFETRMRRRWFRPCGGTALPNPPARRRMIRLPALSGACERGGTHPDPPALHYFRKPNRCPPARRSDPPFSAPSTSGLPVSPPRSRRRAQNRP